MKTVPFLDVLLYLLAFIAEYWKEIIIAFLVFSVLYTLSVITDKYLKEPKSHWHQIFSPIPFTPTEFYTALEERLKTKEMPDISFQTITHFEKGKLSSKRLYLRILFRGYIIDLCAAPFGNEEFFISWWLGDSGSTLQDFLKEMPLIGRLFLKREKTFYEYDTEIVFKEVIASGVQVTIEQLLQSQAQRYTINWDINNNFKGY